MNTDGLVLRGWYTSLTVAVYGTAERSHGHDQGSSPPPPPPPPQQPGGPKRTTKQGGCLPGEIVLDSWFHTLKTELKNPKRSLIPICSDSIVILKFLCSFIVEWEKDDQYNGSPPRPAPRGPRTPPGPPPPDDDDEEQVHVTG